ncbi:MAG: hypothetical protein H6Q57_1209 [Geobacteraceae bacterium]|nr:hypothetical protein [Geobacteraceae bacterium]
MFCMIFLMRDFTVRSLINIFSEIVLFEKLYILTKPAINYESKPTIASYFKPVTDYCSESC